HPPPRPRRTPRRHLRHLARGGARDHHRPRLASTHQRRIMNSLTGPDTPTGMDAPEQLRKDTTAATKLADRRDPLIVEARKAGTTWRAIADAVGMTELAVRKAAARANDGVLPTPEARP